MTTTEGSARVRPIDTTDRPVWAVLFAQYRDFYRFEADPVVVDRVWDWIADADHEVNGLVAEVDGTVVGIAHWRRFPRPSTGTVGIWLDDLFVARQERGHGAAAALIAHLSGLARAEGASVVRWITAQDNDRARALYDRVASATQWVVYDAATG